MIARIICRREVAPDAALPSGLHPVLARVYRARNCASAAELDHSLGALLPPDQLKGIDRAAALLAHAVENERRMLVVADFDADGATSCALMVRGLRLLGAGHVDYVVPNRFEYGYGLTPEIVALAAERDPDLLITVDNGIASVDGVRAARERGIAVLVTDHHLPGPALPEADAIVNPNQPGCPFPSKQLAGVGVAFYCLLALRALLRASGWFARRGLPEPNLARLLDLVALGTVADLVPLDRNNRILVAQGIARMRSGLGNAGIRALVAVAARRIDGLTASDLAYGVAPRLNAAGRLTDMALGIECLLTDDEAQAHEMAARLDSLNRERRVIEAKMQTQALAALAALRLDAESLPRGVCLYDAAWHQGVIGLVASRLKEKLQRPVVAFAPASAHDLKGSARSVAGLHIRDALDAVAARHPGSSRDSAAMPWPRVSRSRAAISTPFGTPSTAKSAGSWTRTISRAASGATASCGTRRLSLELAQLLRDGGPWGQGFPEPLFDGTFDVVERRVVGERHLRLRVRQGGSRTFEAIGFHLAPDGAVPEWSKVRAVYRLEVNEYRGTRSLQLVLEHVEPS